MIQYNLVSMLVDSKRNQEALSLIETVEHTLQTQAGGAQYIEKCQQLKKSIFIANTPPKYMNSFSFFDCHEPDKMIHHAAMEGHHENLIILLDKHPELIDAINQNQEKRWTALHWAIHNNHLHCVVELLNRNALYDIPDKTTDTVTSIDIAIEKANTEICQALTKHIIKKHVKTNDHDAEKALRVAANSGDLSAVKLLIAHGVNINAAGPESGKTALHQAVQKKHHSIVRFLIIVGANVNIEDTLGKKAAEYADQQLAILFLTPLDTPAISR